MVITEDGWIYDGPGGYTGPASKMDPKYNEIEALVQYLRSLGIWVTDDIYVMENELLWVLNICMQFGLWFLAAIIMLLIHKAHELMRAEEDAFAEAIGSMSCGMEMQM